MIVPVLGRGGEAVRELKLSVRPCASAWEELKPGVFFRGREQGSPVVLIGPQSGQGETHRGPVSPIEGRTSKSIIKLLANRGNS